MNDKNKMLEVNNQLSELLEQVRLLSKENKRAIFFVVDLKDPNDSPTTETIQILAGGREPFDVAEMLANAIEAMPEPFKLAICVHFVKFIKP